MILYYPPPPRLVVELRDHWPLRVQHRLYNEFKTHTDTPQHASVAISTSIQIDLLNRIIFRALYIRLSSDWELDFSEYNTLRDDCRYVSMPLT